jgi:hypothetical protein
VKAGAASPSIKTLNLSGTGTARSGRGIYASRHDYVFASGRGRARVRQSAVLIHGGRVLLDGFEPELPGTPPRRRLPTVRDPRCHEWRQALEFEHAGAAAALICVFGLRDPRWVLVPSRRMYVTAPTTSVDPAYGSAS